MLKKKVIEIAIRHDEFFIKFDSCYECEQFETWMEAIGIELFYDFYNEDEVKEIYEVP